MSGRFDVAIAGSGSLGIAAARRLAESGAHVLVLEQREAISDPPGSHYRNAERFRTNPDSYLPAATQYLEFIDDSVPRRGLPGAAITCLMGRYREGCELTWMPFGLIHMTGTTRMAVNPTLTGVCLALHIADEIMQ